MSSESSVTPPKTHRVLIFVIVLGIGAIGLAVSGIMDRARSKQEVAAWTNAQTVPTVRVVRPERGSGEQELILPGNVAAFITGSLYARASGYITAWNKDIGARVTKGEILAAIGPMKEPYCSISISSSNKPRDSWSSSRRRFNRRRPTPISAT